MSLYELSALTYEAMSVIDSGFETWMAATFAIIVVAHTTGYKMNLTLRVLLAVLYISSVALLYGRYSDVMQNILYYQSQLPDQNAMATGARLENFASLRKLIIIFGSLATLAFLLIPKIHAQKGHTKN